MTTLIICPNCQCHVRSTETTCPLCEATLPDALRQTSAPQIPPSGTSRAQVVAFRAAVLAGMAVTTACGGEDKISSACGAGGAAAGGTQSGGTGAQSVSGGSSVGGALQTGGTTASGGMTATGGATASGGVASGGTTSTGGTTETGGTTATGGMGTGGFIAPPYGSVWPDPGKPVRV